MYAMACRLRKALKLHLACHIQRTATLCEILYSDIVTLLELSFSHGYCYVLIFLAVHSRHLRIGLLPRRRALRKTCNQASGEIGRLGGANVNIRLQE